MLRLEEKKSGAGLLFFLLYFPSGLLVQSTDQKRAVGRTTNSDPAEKRELLLEFSNYAIRNEKLGCSCRRSWSQTTEKQEAALAGWFQSNVYEGTRESKT